MNGVVAIVVFRFKNSRDIAISVSYDMLFKLGESKEEVAAKLCEMDKKLDCKFESHEEWCRAILNCSGVPTMLAYNYRYFTAVVVELND